MAIPTEITFHEIEHSDALEASILRWVSRLEQVHERIVHCHVTVGQPHRHHRRGRPFDVHVRLDISGSEIVTSLENEDVYLAVADAFRAARRQLLDELGVRRGKARPPFVTRYQSSV